MVRKNNSYLVVDDDDIFRTRLVTALEDRGFEVESAARVEDALSLLGEYTPDRAILDLKMPGQSGLVLLKKLKERAPETAVVILTGYGSIPTTVEAMKLEATNYITKPAPLEKILEAFEGADTEESLEEGGFSESPSLAQVEWEHIQRVLHDYGGNITKAAKSLGVHRRSLQRKLGRMAPN